MDQRVEKLLRAAQDTAQLAAGRAAEAAGRAGQAVGAAGQAVSRQRELLGVERETRRLRQEVKLQLQALGAMLYATHCGQPSDSEELLAKLRVVDGLEERIRALSAQAETLRRKGK